MASRTVDQEYYRFGFNGKENDNETYGTGNALDFGARIYDPRIGRWLSTDPLQATYPNFSPYAAFVNSPILIVDPDGRDNIVYVVNLPDKNGKKKVSDADLQVILNYANAQINDGKNGLGGVKIKYVVYDPLKYGTDISLNKIDKTDGIILFGLPEDVKSYDRKNHLAEDGIWSRPGGGSNGGWEGIDEPTGPAPGITFERVSYIDSRSVRVGNNDFNSYLFNHETAHQSDNTHSGGDQDHIDITDDKFHAVPNLLMSGPFMQKYAKEAKNPYSITPDKPKSSDAINVKNTQNKYIGNRMRQHFSSPTPKINYPIKK